MRCNIRITPSLHCASCVGFIEDALRQVAGVTEATVNPERIRCRSATSWGRSTFPRSNRRSGRLVIRRPGHWRRKDEPADDESAAHERSTST